MIKTVILSSIFLLFLTGCSVAQEEPGSSNPLSEATSDGQQPDSVKPGLPTPTPETPPQNPGVTLVSPSGEVNLGELTPNAGGDLDGELRVMPAPGVPDPSVKLVQRVQQDLAGRLGVDISDITVVEVQAVEWRDSSLGCPAPGMMYLMVITPGYQVTLEAGGDQYEYHTDQGENVVLCEGGQPSPPGP